MAIVKMKKFTFLTFESYKDDLLKDLQRFESVHFKNLQKNDLESDLKELEFLKKDSSAELVSKYESELSKIKFTMEKLEPYAQKPKGLKALTTPKKTMSFDEFNQYHSGYDYEKIYTDVKELDEALKAMKTERNKIKTDNDNLRSWVNLDISITQLEECKSVSYFLGSIGKMSKESFLEMIESQFGCSYVEFLGSIKDETAALILIPKESFEEAQTVLKNLGFSKINLNTDQVPAKQIEMNNQHFTELESSEMEITQRIKQYEEELPKLEIVYDYFKTALERAKACENFLKMESVVLIEGWVPEDETENLKRMIQNCCGDSFYLEEETVEKDSDEVPIKLKNGKMVTAFEDITNMYSMPKYNEIDPTPLLTPFYLLFFGLMIGDAGYGIILLLGSIVGLKYLQLGKGTRNFLSFLFYLSFSTILAGILYSSIFGFSFFTPIKTADGYKAILDSQIDIVVMIVLSIVVGFIQIVFGLLVKGYMLIRDGKPFSALFDSLFWIITLISGTAMLLSMAGLLSDGIGTISKWIFWLMLIGLTLTQGRENASIGGKLAGGLYGVYGLSGYVGDLVSYTRLVALALSGAYIAYSFNLMAGLMPLGIIRIVAGGLIFIFGQTLNLGLSVLGAYVHTCRLQYVEYFSKFYEGGGIPFSPFQLKNEYIDIYEQRK